MCNCDHRRGYVCGAHRDRRHDRYSALAAAALLRVIERQLAARGA